MAMFDNELDGSPVVQSEYEDTRWRIDLWDGCAPSTPTCLIDEITGPDTYSSDLTTTLMHGSAFVDGDAIYTSFVYHGVAPKEYRVRVRFTTAGNLRERWFRIRMRK